MKKLLSIIVSASITLTIFYASSCSKKKITVYDCAGISPTYNSGIKAILDAQCATAGCHNASSKAKGIDLSSYTSAKNQGGNDNFLGSIQHIKGYDAMPKNASKLDDVSIKALSCWVQNGRPE